MSPFLKVEADETPTFPRESLQPPPGGDFKSLPVSFMNFHHGAVAPPMRKIVMKLPKHDLNHIGK